MFDILTTVLSITIFILVVLVFVIVQLSKQLKKEKSNAKLYRTMFLGKIAEKRRGNVPRNPTSPPDVRDGDSDVVSFVSTGSLPTKRTSR